MLEAALAAVRQIFSPPFRNVLLKSLGMTFAVSGAGLGRAGQARAVLRRGRTIPGSNSPSLMRRAPASSFFSPFSSARSPCWWRGYFSTISRMWWRRTSIRRARADARFPAGQAVLMGLRFALVSAGVNLLALLLLLVPGVNAVAFIFANAYLLGREYFLFAATRFRSLDEATELRRRYAPQLLPRGPVHRRLRRDAGPQCC